jgi:uncharacterized membrane protein
MTLESNKTLGGIGAILLFIGLIPYGEPFIGIISLVGLILVLISLYGFANLYKERGIFNNSIYGIIAGIVGAVIAGVVVVFYVLAKLKTFLETVYPSWNGTDWTKLSGLTPNTSNVTWSAVSPLIGGLVLTFVVLWVFTIIGAFFARRSLKLLSAKTGVGLFSTSALLLIIGAILAIVLIGLLLMWIAVLLMAIAFFQIKAQPEQPVTTMASPSTPTAV